MKSIEQLHQKIFDSLHGKTVTVNDKKGEFIVRNSTKGSILLRLTFDDIEKGSYTVFFGIFF